jgi:hypothetical protein
LVISPPLEENPAADRRVDAGNDIDQGRFAGAVGSDETQHLARSNLQIDRLQGLKTTKTPRDRLEPQESLGHRIISAFPGAASTGGRRTSMASE